jgi:hypothetical protein
MKLWIPFLFSPGFITFLSPRWGLPSSIVASEWPHKPHKVISFNSTNHSRLPVVSIVALIVISKFLHCTILVTISARSFFQQNFNLKWTRIQCGLDLGCYWMLFFTVEKGLLARARRINRYTRPPSKNEEGRRFLFLEFWYQIWFLKYQIILMEVDF